MPDFSTLPLPAGFQGGSRRLLACLACLAWLPMTTAGQSPDEPSGFSPAQKAEAKARYTLFDPTPRNLMRELSPDRPDKTESPHTVDAGHFQLEMDLANFSRDRHERVEAWNVAPFNLKAGLLSNVDFQIVFDNYLYSRNRAEAPRVRSGVGDLTTRLKVNLWGNDGGRTAFALMPFVKFPTHTDSLGNRGTEGGLILPLAIELPGEWGMGLMTEVDVLRNGSGGGYHAEFVNSITVSHAIVGNLGGYLEFFSAVSTEHAQDWVGTVDCGLTYKINDDVQLDGGVNVGVSRAAEDINPFVGLTWRF